MVGLLPHSGSILDFQLGWKSGKFQLARWSHEAAILCSWNHPPTRPTGSVGNQKHARWRPQIAVCPHLFCLSPPFMSVPTYFVCPHLYVCPHVLYPSSPIMSVPNHHFNCLQALLKSWSFGECQSASGMFLKGIWTRSGRFNGFFKSQKRSLPKKCFRIHTRLHLGFSAKLKIWQAPGCKMEPQSGIITCNIPTHPPAK